MTAHSRQLPYREKLAVLYEGVGDIVPFQQLADRLAVPLQQAGTLELRPFLLTWRAGCLTLFDRQSSKKGGLTVEIEPRPGEQRSWPAPKNGALAHALGRKTRTVVDATTGWGQDSLHIFRMGYRLVCIERSPVMLELLGDAFRRLKALAWVRCLNLAAPALLAGNAIELLADLEAKPDCIYLDPMFPVKRKKSALARKSMTVLRNCRAMMKTKRRCLPRLCRLPVVGSSLKVPSMPNRWAANPMKVFKENCCATTFILNTEDSGE